MGSCNKVNEDNPFWPEILRRQPAAWVWMGDNVYAVSVN
jgi:alkaline phosphatase D